MAFDNRTSFVQQDRSKQLVERITRSQLYKDYERAFSQATRMPLSFQPVEKWQPVQKGKKHENRFCALIAKQSKSCANCLEQQEKLSNPQADGTSTILCFAGLCESSVPVRVGNEILGFLHTGQVALKAPTAEGFKKISKQLMEWGIHTDLKNFEDAYFHTKVISKTNYQAMLRLLEVFSQHLSLSADHLMIQQENAEPVAIARAKQFINENKSEDLSLNQVAKLVNMSTFYFCKMFKKATGMTFTEYLSLVRIAKAKNLLLNPNLRISEIAYEVGFQSLTHFNRVFRKVAGQSPSQYRSKLPTSGI